MKKWIVFLFVFLYVGYVFAQDIDTSVSIEDTINAETTILNCPKMLSAKALNDHTISLKWQRSNNNIVGYMLFRKKGDEKFIEISRIEKSEITYVDKNLKFNLNYSYKIQCYKQST